MDMEKKRNYGTKKRLLVRLIGPLASYNNIEAIYYVPDISDVCKVLYSYNFFCCQEKDNSFTLTLTCFLDYKVVNTILYHCGAKLFKKNIL